MINQILTTAYQKYLDVRVFPILYVIDLNKAIVLGTGCIIENDGIKYVLTARHVLEEDKGLDYKRMAFPFYGPKESILNFQHKPYFSDKKYNADIAVVPLYYDGVDLSKLYWKSFTLESFSINESIDDVIVYGYPKRMQLSEIADPLIDIGVISFMTTIYTGNYDNIKNYNENIDIIFNYKSEMKVNGVMEKVGDLHGISGSPIYCIEPNNAGLWAPEKTLKIIGIQKAVSTNEYIRATKASCIRGALQYLFKVIH